MPIERRKQHLKNDQVNIERIECEAKDIVNSLSEKMFSIEESLLVLQKADGKIRTIMGILAQKRSKTALKDALKAAED